MWLRPNFSTVAALPSGHHESEGCRVGRTHAGQGSLLLQEEWVEGNSQRQEQVKSQYTLRPKHLDEIISYSFFHTVHQTLF